MKERWKMNKYIQHNQKWKNEERQRNRQKEKKPTVMKNGTWRARQDTKLRMRQLKYGMTLQSFVSSCNPLFYLIKLSCLLCFMVLWIKIFLLRQQNVLYPEESLSGLYAIQDHWPVKSVLYSSALIRDGALFQCPSSPFPCLQSFLSVHNTELLLWSSM